MTDATSPARNPTIAVWVRAAYANVIVPSNPVCAIIGSAALSDIVRSTAVAAVIARAYDVTLSKMVANAAS
jgi:hypothetical protein